ncbi:MAG TPA: T9SS type A sorting domain-containing protein [Bacteroidia bacterium]|nr:T9SS type A sorting domain-containing protein [Bacteroidia bacterium]
MKKLFFKAAPVIIGAAFFFPQILGAQSTSDIYDFNGNDVKGDTMYFWVPAGGTHYIDYNQFNVSENDVTYKVQKSYPVIMPGASAWFCVFCNGSSANPQSQCYTPSGMFSGDFYTQPDSFNMLLCDFAAGPNFGTSLVRYKFYDVNNPADSAWILLWYNVTPVGIAESFVPAGALNNVYPNPSNGTTNISYSSNTAKSEVVITDLTGKEIYREQTAQQTGILSVNTQECAQGMYMISLVSDGVVVSRKKLIVQ